MEWSCVWDSTQRSSMKHRKITRLRTLIAGLALTVTFHSLAQSPVPPNLLFVYPDQMRMHAMGIWSQPGYSNILATFGDPVHTPNMDQLAREGVLFTQASSTRPVCSPYRAAMMSGMYSQRNGVDQNCYVGRNVGLRHDISAFTDVLAAAGYETALVGKTHWETNKLLFDASGTYVGPGGGFTPHNFDTYIPPGPGRHGIKFWFQHLANGHYNAMSYANKPYLIAGKADGVQHLSGRFTPLHEADIVINYINNVNGERDTSKPFSLFWAPNPPHSPYSSLGDVDPSIYNTHYAGKTIAELGLRSNFVTAAGSPYIRYYFSLVTSIDQQLGRVLQALEASGVASNTIVVFTSDHGELMGSQNDTGKNAFYDEAFLIPLIMRYPGRTTHRIEDLRIAPVDLMPTLLSMMGLKQQIPLSVQGFDYSQGILNNDYSQQPKPASALYRKKYEAGVRTGQYSYMVRDDGSTVTTRLHDLTSDPYQMTNLALGSIPGEDLAFLKRELGWWLKKSEDEWFLANNESGLITYPPGDHFNLTIDHQRMTFDVPKDATVRVEVIDSLTNSVWQTVSNYTSPGYASRQAFEIHAAGQDSRFFRVAKD